MSATDHVATLTVPVRLDLAIEVRVSSKPDGEGYYTVSARRSLEGNTYHRRYRSRNKEDAVAAFYNDIESHPFGIARAVAMALGVKSSAKARIKEF